MASTTRPIDSGENRGAVPGADNRLRRISLTQRVLGRPAAGALIIAVIVWIVFAILSVVRTPVPAFIQLSGTLNYLDVAAQVGILATSVALLMIAGEFDLSIGSMVGFAGIIIGIGVTEFGMPLWSAILVSIGLTTVLGVINGIIVVRTGLPSFIVTLATLLIIRGMTSVLTSLVTPITFIPLDRGIVAADPIAVLFNWSVNITLFDITGQLRVSILWWILIAAIGAYVLGKTRFGNWIAGAGGSPAAARNLGVPVARVKITLFAMTALSAAILAAIQTATFFSADVKRGGGNELDAITTAVIGGTLLTGGYGSVVGTAIGALALGMAKIGVSFASINADWYFITIGTLLLVAVVLNNWIRRRYGGIR
jgi:simple sugar transport system permease protein